MLQIWCNKCVVYNLDIEQLKKKQSGVTLGWRGKVEKRTYNVECIPKVCTGDQGVVENYNEMNEPRARAHTIFVSIFLIGEPFFVWDSVNYKN